MPVCALSQKSKDTALTIAADRGHADVVRLLLQKGANVTHQVGTADLFRVVSVSLSFLSCSPALWLAESSMQDVHEFLFSDSDVYPELHTGCRWSDSAVQCQRK